MTRLVWVLVLGAFEMAVADGLPAQDRDHTHGGHPHAVSGRVSELSERARAQLRDVESSVRHLDTPEAARRAGFRPALGWIPSMGVHWVHADRTRDGFDVMNPDHLMFSPVDGSMKLVGVAYAFRGAPDAPVPNGFDGEHDRWHDHPRLAPGGETLHMLHVWFVESPDGPFAGHNPWLPFFAAGLTPPDAERMAADPTADARIRSLAAALAVLGEPTLFERVAEAWADPAALQSIEARRDSIRGLVPRLERARRAGDLDAWDRLGDEAARHWHAIRAAWIEAIPSEAGRERLASLLDVTMGGGGGAH